MVGRWGRAKKEKENDGAGAESFEKYNWLAREGRRMAAEELRPLPWRGKKQQQPQSIYTSFASMNGVRACVPVPVPVGLPL